MTRWSSSAALRIDAPAPPSAAWSRVVLTPEDLERIWDPETGEPRPYEEHASYKLTIELPRCACGAARAIDCACHWSRTLPGDDGAPAGGERQPLCVNRDPAPVARKGAAAEDLATGWCAAMQTKHGVRTW